MSTRWNFERDEQLTKYLDAAHSAAKDYLSVHAEQDSSTVYRLSDEAANNYLKSPAVRDSKTAYDYAMTIIREALSKQQAEPAKAKRKHGERIPEEILEEAEKLLKDGTPRKEISEKLGIGISSIGRLAKKLEAKPDVPQAEKGSFEENERKEVETNVMESEKSKETENISDIRQMINFVQGVGADYLSFMISVNGKQYAVSISEVKNNEQNSCS